MKPGGYFVPTSRIDSPQFEDVRTEIIAKLAGRSSETYGPPANRTVRARDAGFRT